MDEINRNSDQQEVIERLRNLSLEPVPDDLTDKIMARIPVQKPSLLSTLWAFISQPQSISFRPAYAFGIALLVCCAFILGRNTRQVPVQVATVPVSAPQLQPEMLENPESAYLVGRGLLRAQNSEDQALAFLQRASVLQPENPEFAYWEGVGHWANGNSDEERRSYLRGLTLDPKNVPLLINLGHNYLGEKKYDDALNAYQTVLANYPDEPVVLYNTGLIYRAQGRTSEEISSWQSFLQDNRQGAKSFRAVHRLNSYGDYEFRVYGVGGRKVIINQHILLDDSQPFDLQVNELAEIAAILDDDEKLELEIVVFIENDREAARKRAFEIKKIINSLTTTDIKSRVRMSWFDVPEAIKRDDADPGVNLSEGLLLFSQLFQEKEKEVSI